MSSATCSCGHSREAHQHYRRGSDCAVCGAAGCARFRRQGLLGAVRTWATGARAGKQRDPEGRTALASPSPLRPRRAPRPDGLVPGTDGDDRPAAATGR